MPKGYCIECDTPIKLGNSPTKGQQVTCVKCGAFLEVVSVSPIELDWAYEEEPDYWSEVEEGRESKAGAG